MKIFIIQFSLFIFEAGGGTGTRTLDIQLAKLALYQLSYTPLPSERRESRDKKLNRALRAISHAQVKGFKWLRAIARFSTPMIHGCSFEQHGRESTFRRGV